MSDHKIMKVVGPHELELATTQGWELVSILSSSRVDQGAYRDVPNISPVNPDGYGRQDTLQLSAPLVVQDLHFLVAKTADSIVHDLSEQIGRLLETVGEYEKTIAIHNERVQKLEGALERAQEYSDELRNRSLASSDKARKLEGDVGKLRSEIGEAKARSLLGEDNDDGQ